MKNRFAATMTVMGALALLGASNVHAQVLRLDPFNPAAFLEQMHGKKAAGKHPKPKPAAKVTKPSAKAPEKSAPATNNPDPGPADNSHHDSDIITVTPPATPSPAPFHVPDSALHGPFLTVNALPPGSHSSTTNNDTTNLPTVPPQITFGPANFAPASRPIIITPFRPPLISPFRP